MANVVRQLSLVCCVQGRDFEGHGRVEDGAVVKKRRVLFPSVPRAAACGTCPACRNPSWKQACQTRRLEAAAHASGGSPDIPTWFAIGCRRTYEHLCQAVQTSPPRMYVFQLSLPLRAYRVVLHGPARVCRSGLLSKRNCCLQDTASVMRPQKRLRGGRMQSALRHQQSRTASITW